MQYIYFIAIYKWGILISNLGKEVVVKFIKNIKRKIKGERMNKKEAIIFLEYQNDFLREGGALYDLVQDKERLIKKSIDVLEGARRKNVTIIHIPLQNTGNIKNNYGILASVKQAKAFQKYDAGVQFIESMEPKTTEVVIQNKCGISAFNGTDLEGFLRKKRISHITFAGLLTHICIESSVRSAYDKGFNIEVISDAVTSIDQEAHQQTLQKSLPLFASIIKSDEWLKNRPERVMDDE